MAIESAPAARVDPGQTTVPASDAKYRNRSTMMNGRVHLWGSYRAARQDEAMVVAAENAHGVRAVRSHLCRVDPVSGLTVYNPDEEKERKAEGP